MKKAMTVSVILTLATSFALAAPNAPATTAAATTTEAKAPAVESTPAQAERVEAAVGTTSTTAAATEVKAAKKWSGTLSINPEFGAEGANRAASSNRAKNGSMTSENYLGVSYKATDKTSVALRQYFYNTVNFAAKSEESEHSYMGPLVPVVTTSVGGVAGSKDITLQGRVYIGTDQEVSRDANLNVSYYGLLDVPWEVSSKLTLSYNLIPQVYSYWDQDAEMRFMNAGLATYQITDNISMTQIAGWRPRYDSVTQGRLIQELVYVDTSASFKINDMVSVDLGLYQEHQTYGNSEKSNTTRSPGPGSKVRQDRYAQAGSSTAFELYNESETMYYLLTGIKF